MSTIEKPSSTKALKTAQSINPATPPVADADEFNDKLIKLKLFQMAGRIPNGEDKDKRLGDAEIVLFWESFWEQTRGLRPNSSAVEELMLERRIEALYENEDIDR